MRLSAGLRAILAEAPWVGEHQPWFGGHHIVEFLCGPCVHAASVDVVHLFAHLEDANDGQLQSGLGQRPQLDALSYESSASHSSRDGIWGSDRRCLALGSSARGQFPREAK